MNWDRVYVSVWYGLIALMLLLEVYSLVDRRSSTPALTEVIVREVPWWVTVPFLAWLFIHFTSRYLGRAVL